MRSNTAAVSLGKDISHQRAWGLGQAIAGPLGNSMPCHEMAIGLAQTFRSIYTRAAKGQKILAQGASPTGANLTT